MNNSKKKKVISCLVACFNEEKNIIEMYERLQSTFSKTTYDYECIFIDNASDDNSVSLYEKLAKKDKRVKAIVMSRNFGSPQPSFLAGMEYAKGEAIVFLQGDIQDPPEVIPRFLEKWENGFDIVYGVSKKREGVNPIMRIAYKMFYRILNRLSYLPHPVETGDFSLVDKKVASEISAFKEYDLLIRGIRSYVGFKQTGISYIRKARLKGKKTTNFLQNVWWAKTIIINFSLRPLEWISRIAIIVVMFSIAVLLYNVGGIILGFETPRGIPTIIFLILFIGGVQLLALSVIAEYLAKIFIEIKGRPRYIIGKKINL